MISSPSPVSIIIYHFRIKMNRTGQSLGRILTNSFFKKFEILPSTSLVYRNYHPASSRQEILKFAPSHICFEPNRRFFFSTKDTKADGAKNETIEEEVKEVSENEKVLQEKLAEIEEKNSDLLDKYKRSLADFENLRNRMNRQVADAKMFGIQGFCKVVTTISYLLFYGATVAGSARRGRRSQQSRQLCASGPAGGVSEPAGPSSRSPPH